MPHGHRLQSSRFEFKYRIDDSLARPLRDFARAYLVPDEHAHPENNWEYPVHSLYLDSRSLALCRATMQGQKNRFKLRIRFYDDDPTHPVYFEIKRRQDDVILKQRACVRRDVVGRLLAGHVPAGADLGNGDDCELGPLMKFTSLQRRLQAEGQVIVSYQREAWVTPDSDAVRMTFDRNIGWHPYRGTYDLHRALPAQSSGVKGVVLELKFTDRFPRWMRLMIRTFDLQRRSMAKYVVCVRRMTRSPMLGQRGQREVRA